MALHIRNPEADRLARELARIDRTSITDAVIVALRETVRNRMNQEKPWERCCHVNCSAVACLTGWV